MLHSLVSIHQRPSSAIWTEASQDHHLIPLVSNLAQHREQPQQLTGSALDHLSAQNLHQVGDLSKAET